MVYYFVIGSCICCERTFAFNPRLVPSTSVATGQREPICRNCIDRINQRRRRLGIELWPVLEGAYQPEEDDYE